LPHDPIVRRSPSLSRQASSGCAALVVVAALWLAGCGYKEPAVCAKLPGTAEQLAGTPRTDSNLESLALSLSEGITADDDIYRRLVRDIAAIRAADPRMRTIKYAAPDFGRLLVAPEGRKKFLVKLGLYTEWDCLNRHFGASQVAFQNGFAVLQFKGRYNLNRLGAIYSGLKGVQYASPNARLSYENPASIYVMPDPNGWRYVFGGAQTCRTNDIACGLYYFVVSPDGIVKHTEEWRTPPNNTPELEPSWLRDAHAAAVREVEKRNRESGYPPPGAG
jgi:hypothetical protein